MKTTEQEVVEAKARLGALKLDVGRSMQAYTDAKNRGAPAAEVHAAVLACKNSATAYFNYAESFVEDSDLLGAYKSPMWVKGFAETCASILSSMPQIYKFLSVAYSQDPALRGISHLPDATAFAGMQRLVVQHIARGEAKAIKKSFEAENLPVYGFDNPAGVRPEEKKLKTYLAVGVGLFFAIIILAITVFNPHPTASQSIVYRILLAVACGGIAAVIPGMITVKVSNFITAGGAMAVIVLVYFWNPAQ